jgi:alpha-L-rhamnosidase
VVQNLVHDVRELHQLHITTGNLATKFILEVLTDAGYGDIALGLVTQTTYPSWGYMLRNGATTIWERWEIASGAEMNSHSHPMYASVGAWLYRALGGLRLLPQSVGCSHLRIEPLPAHNISAVQASLTTIRGTVSVNWRWVAPDFTFDLALPVGCEAEVVFPPRETPITAVYDGAELIWQRAGSARRTPGISEVHADDGTLMLKIGSGTYRLRAHYA